MDIIDVKRLAEDILDRKVVRFNIVPTEEKTYIIYSIETDDDEVEIIKRRVVAWAVDVTDFTSYPVPEGELFINKRLSPFKYIIYFSDTDEWSFEGSIYDNSEKDYEVFLDDYYNQ